VFFNPQVLKRHPWTSLLFFHRLFVTDKQTNDVQPILGCETHLAKANATSDVIVGI